MASANFMSETTFPVFLRQLNLPLHPAVWTDYVALVVFAGLLVVYLTRGLLWDVPDPYYHVYFERPQSDGKDQNSAKSNQTKAQRSIAKKLNETDKRAVIFWGSQSGTAERFATQLAKECQSRFGLGCLAADLSDYDAESIAELAPTQLAIFILSTYGEGDPSDNATGFWDWINNNLNNSNNRATTHPAAAPLLSNLQYAAFGLGNSNYKYFNRVVDVVAQTLTENGATLLLPVGKADDAQRSTEEDFLAWKDALYAMFRTYLGLEERVVEYQPAITIVEDESLTSIDLHHGEPVGVINNSNNCSPIRALSIKNARELFAPSLSGTDRNCVHMELDLAEYPDIHYKTGDHLGVWPINPNHEVDELLTALQLHERQDVPVLLKSVEGEGAKLQLPSPTTVRALFTHYLEVSAPVSRSTIQGLLAFAPTAEAKSYLLKLAQDKDVYASYLATTHLTLGRLLRLASPNEPWTALPLSFVVEALPPIQPRYYSISSSSVLSPRRAAITALVAADALPANPQQKINGVASNYLLALSKSQSSHAHDSASAEAKDIAPPEIDATTYDVAGPSNLLQGTKLFAHVRKSKFKLPLQSSCPIIMVAAGTGLAPFRAFVAERAKLHSIGKPVGEMLLFFGCRHPDEDFIYRDELMRVAVAGSDQDSDSSPLLKVVTAFSRLPGEPKVYVQQRVREYGRQVVDLIEDKGANFYICGRAAMAREVGASVAEAIKEARGWDDSQVKSWTEGLKRRGKWREDVWG
ncbi:hypothetical protein HRR83_004656 [Exophiala dermatitidis]|uniref:NADPH--hemoprotein reductase n=2 Tax=Exophiala dermatitidis TaxID=5970 RepID=H6BRR0_EXODN|nr:NADPH-ferrihemoprotein reductase [Exophiala dermatitidis NIH/UT8656]KAJ4515640.1 hypothetical protein HRR75_003719 [Exophiala dermatitidis]EHY54012.1 NADPH-ferrihemoprotein reductase [Exophiala dermatitidis NIH/UT8656]KAJ4519322.1 hypothetical protein HRR74_004063 [Exophiala dermatitidis]KAJ4529138.1 hypothetical protein HRR73_000158 [Exophiala dermatitidis]KAJ4538538.1 hypothetical protein HRR77_007021 [Exophiala dermatitidis]